MTNEKLLMLIEKSINEGALDKMSRAQLDAFWTHGTELLKIAKSQNRRNETLVQTARFIVSSIEQKLGLKPIEIKIND